MEPIFDNADVDAAMAVCAAGRAEDAFDELCRALLARPNSVDGVAALRDMAASQDRFADAAPALVAAMRYHLRNDNPDLAIDLWTAAELPDGLARMDFLASLRKLLRRVDEDRS